MTRVRRSRGREKGSYLVLEGERGCSTAALPRCWALSSTLSFALPSLRGSALPHWDPAVPRLGSCEQGQVLGPGDLCLVLHFSALGGEHL